MVLRYLKSLFYLPCRTRFRFHTQIEFPRGFILDFARCEFTLWFLICALLPVALALNQIAELSQGWIFADSFIQWETAYRMLTDPFEVLRKSRTQWPVIMTVLKYFTLKMGFTPTHYIIAQAAILNLAVLISLAAILRNRWLALIPSTIVWAHPIYRNYAVFHCSDTLMALALLLLFGALAYRIQGGRLGLFWICCCVAALSLVRFNGIGVGALLGIAWAFCSQARTFSKRVIPPAAVFLASLATIPAEQIVPRQNFPIWSLGIIARNYYLYTKTGDSPLGEALQPITKDLSYPWRDRCFLTVWCETLFPTNVSFGVPPQAAKQNLSAFLDYAGRYPRRAVSALATFASFSWGVAAPLKEAEIGGNNAFPTNSNGTNNWFVTATSAKAQAEIQALHSAATAWGSIIARPWIHSLALGVAALGLLFLGAYRWAQLSALALLLSLASYLPITVISQSAELRYYFPSVLITMVFFLSLVVDRLVALAHNFLASGRRSTAHPRIAIKSTAR